MWDEQERFANVVSKTVTWLVVALGVVLAATSLALGSFEIFLAYLMFLGILVAIALSYGLAAGCVGGVLLGFVWGWSHCRRWLLNRLFKRH